MAIPEWKPVATETIRPSVQALLAAEDRMKERVALLLHGPIQTRLLLLSLDVGKCLQLLPDRPEEAAALLDKVLQDIDDLRDKDVRRIGRLLHPPALAVGLVAGIRALARQLRRHFIVTVDVNEAFHALDGPVRVDDDGGGWRLNCYRIVEECLNNVCLHADARRVQVGLYGAADRSWMRLTVEDDGRGFDPKTTPRGLGLQTVAARAGQWGGTTTIQSEPGRGTKIVVQWALPQDDEPQQAGPAASGDASAAV